MNLGICTVPCADIPSTLGLKVEILYSFLRMRGLLVVNVQMESNIGLLGHIEIILELFENVASAKESPETTLKGPEALNNLVRVQEVKKLKGKFPELPLQVTKILADLWKIGKFLFYLGKM